MPTTNAQHFGRKHNIGKMSSEKLDKLEKTRAEVNKQNYDDMKKYTDKDEWDKHLKSKIKAKVKEKQADMMGKNKKE